MILCRMNNFNWVFIGRVTIPPLFTYSFVVLNQYSVLYTVNVYGTMVVFSFPYDLFFIRLYSELFEITCITYRFGTTRD